MTIIETDIFHLPLEELHEHYNPGWTNQFGWRLPDEFEGTAVELEALQSGCGLIDKSYTGRISVSGETAQDFLHRMTSAPINDLQPGHGMETVVTTSEGRFVDWVTVFRSMEDEIFLLGAPGSQEKIIGHLQEYIFFKDDVHFERIGQNWITLQMSGPGAHIVLNEIFGMDFRAVDHYRLISKNFGNTPVTGTSVNDVTGHDILLFIPANEQQWVAELLETSEKKWVHVGYHATEIARMKAGIPRYPGEINEEHIPPEAHIEKAVDLDSCFAGQEVIARTINYEKIKQHLCHVEIDAEQTQTIELPVNIKSDNHKIGEITSLIWSPMDEKYLGLGYVRTKYLPEEFPLVFSTEPGELEGKVTRITAKR